MDDHLPEFDSLPAYVEHYARTRPDAAALIWDGGRATWEELQGAMLRATASLRARGVEPGDRIAVLGPPRPEVVVSFLAALGAHAIWLGLNPVHAEAELARTVGDAQPKLILVAPRCRGRELAALVPALRAAAPKAHVELLPEIAALDGLVQALGAMPPGEPLAEAAPTRPALLVYTSGTSGRPKGALLPSLAMTLCSRVQHAHWGARAGPTRLINPFPISHVAFLLDLTCLVLVGGGAMVLHERFDPARYLAAIAAERINVVPLVPTMHQMLLQHPAFEAADLSSVELAAFGGAAASLDLIRMLKARFPRVSGAYGSTETAGQVLFSGEDDTAEQIAGSLGRPVADYELRLRTVDGRIPELGGAGEIQVRGDFVLRGYWNDEAATEAAFTKDGWLRTGDLAQVAPDGTWKLLGRLSQAFKSGGYNVHPREVELRLEEHPDVTAAVVAPAPDPLFGQVGIAFVERRPGAELDAAALEAWSRQGLANYKVPKRFVVTDRLPTLAVGKIDRARLAEEAAKLAAASVPSPKESVSCAAWS